MSDLLDIQGAWKVLRLEQDGKSAPDAGLVKMIIFKDDQMWFRMFFQRSNDFGDAPAHITLDPTQNPKRIEQTTDGKTYKGIYELNGDTLQLCWRRTPDTEPPSEFATYPASDCRLLVLQRHHPAKSSAAS